MSGFRARGFTLVELMVVVAIVAVLLAVGLPSFRDSLQRNRVATLSNEIIGSVSLARNEAIRTTRGAGVCASFDGATCGNDWNAGWLVWANVGAANGTLDAGDEIVRVIDAHPKMRVVATVSGVTTDTIAFDSRGRALAPAQINMRPDSCPAGRKLVRQIRVNAVGQIQTTQADCAP
ncbi:MAG: GspH/FimT family pseudopilin [Luteimonas sp.]